MHALLKEICDLLDAISGQMTKLNDNDKQTVAEIWGIPSLPPITPNSLSVSLLDIRLLIENNETEELTEIQEWNTKDCISILNSIKQSVIPNIYNSPQNNINAFMHSISYINNSLSSAFAWTRPGLETLPNALTRKLHRIESDLSKLMPDKDEMEKRISTIREADEAAQALPTTMQELRSTQAQVSSISSKSSELLGKITANVNSVENTLAEIKVHAERAAKLAEQAAEAHRITTTVGLAAAFDARANSLNVSLRWWVSLLISGLSFLMAIGAYRLYILKDALASEPFDAARVWIQVILSVFSIGAPLWFSWLATKQISQRFRLAEDYAFKASVAKAYEGYRRQAASIDPNFERALFASALTRLDEAPLRLVEMETHGSPVHEFAKSELVKGIGEALARVTGKGFQPHDKAPTTSTRRDSGQQPKSDSNPAEE